MENIYKFLNNSFVQIVITAIVSYCVAKIQANSNSNNIDKQIRAELKKIEKQYEYEMKRDNRNYLNKIMLDKSFDVHKRVSNYLRTNLLLLDDIHELLKNEKINNASKASKLSELLTKHADNYEWDHVDTDLIMVYMPDLEEDWKEIYAIDNLLNQKYYDDLYYELKKSDEPIDEVFLEVFELMVNEFDKLGNKLTEDLRREIRKSIIELSE